MGRRRGGGGHKSSKSESENAHTQCIDRNIECHSINRHTTRAAKLHRKPDRQQQRRGKERKTQCTFADPPPACLQAMPINEKKGQQGKRRARRRRKRGRVTFFLCPFFFLLPFLSAGGALLLFSPSLAFCLLPPPFFSSFVVLLVLPPFPPPASICFSPIFPLYSRLGSHTQKVHIQAAGGELTYVPLGPAAACKYIQIRQTKHRHFMLKAGAHHTPPAKAGGSPVPSLSVF